MERGETDGRHRDSGPLAADKRATSPLAVRHPKQFGLVARVPKLRAPCLFRLAALVWSLGSGHADGNVTVLLMGVRAREH